MTELEEVLDTCEVCDGREWTCPNHEAPSLSEEPKIMKVKRTYFANVRFIIEERYDEEPMSEKELRDEMDVLFIQVARKYNNSERYRPYEINMEEVLEYEVEKEDE